MELLTPDLNLCVRFQVQLCVVIKYVSGYCGTRHFPHSILGMQWSKQKGLLIGCLLPHSGTPTEVLSWESLWRFWQGTSSIFINISAWRWCKPWIRHLDLVLNTFHSYPLLMILPCFLSSHWLRSIQIQGPPSSLGCLVKEIPLQLC